MIFLVESVDVRPDDVDAYVAGFETHYLPGALDARRGARGLLAHPEADR